MNDPVVTEAFDVLLELCQRGAVGPIEEGLRLIAKDTSALRTLKICLKQVDRGSGGLSLSPRRYRPLGHQHPRGRDPVSRRRYRDLCETCNPLRFS